METTSIRSVPESSKEVMKLEDTYLYEEIEMYTELPQPSKEPVYDEPLVSSHPTPLNVPATVPSGSAEHDDDGVYEKILHILKEQFDPSQMDAIAQMLQSTKLSVDQEKTLPRESSVAVPPQIPPPANPPPPPLDMDIYPDLEEDSDSEEENRKPRPKPYTNMPVSKPKIRPPVPPKPKGWRELKPSKSREDIWKLSEYYYCTVIF